jgi:signal transduction histidine kinase
MLSLELGQTDEPNGHDAPVNTRMETIRQHCSEIARDVQALSHELHSSKLDYLGVIAALGSFCRDISQQQNVNVEFTYENVSNPLPGDVSLCLFRVAQEALHNAVKHSGVRRFLVDLRGTENHIQLEIRDAGVGFNMQAAMRNGGSGLISMQERVHLVKGTFSVESRVNDGTRIVAIVPLLEKMNVPSMAATI